MLKTNNYIKANLAILYWSVSKKKKIISQNCKRLFFRLENSLMNSMCFERIDLDFETLDCKYLYIYV